jgi:hypothetical protein
MYTPQDTPDANERILSQAGEYVWLIGLATCNTSIVQLVGNEDNRLRDFDIAKVRQFPYAMPLQFIDRLQLGARGCLVQFQYW